MNRSICGLVVVCATFGCSGVPGAASHPTASAASASASASTGADVGAPLAPHRVSLGAAHPARLTISTLLPIVGAEKVLAVSQFADHDQAYAQVLDNTTLGPVIALGDEPLFNAFARGDDLVLATTNGAVACLSKWPASTARAAVRSLTRTCELKEGDALVPIGDHYVAVWAEPAEDAHDKRDGADPPKPGEKAKPPKPATPAKKPPKGPKKPGKKPNPRARPDPKAASTPKKLAIVRQNLDANGALDGADAVTDLEFMSPMPGMDVVAATTSGTGDRVRILFYEHTGPAKGRPKNVIAKSRMVLASLDENGVYDAASRRPLADDDLMFGFLSTHQDPRVITTSRGTMLLGTLGTHGKCEASITSPFFMAMIPDGDLCAFHPSGYFDIADAVRTNQKAGGDGGKASTPVAPTIDPLLKDAHRALGQLDTDPVRAAFYGDRSYALVGDDVVTFTDPAHAEKAPRPLVANRLRVAWSAFASDGAGVALLDDGLVAIGADGAVGAAVKPELAAGAFDRDDIAERDPRRAARVKGAFYGARGAIAPIDASDATAIATYPFDTAVLVGGADHGLVIEAKGGAVEVSSFTPPKDVATRGSVPIDLASGFDAVERRAGGAIVAGRQGRSKDVIAFAIDADGHATKPLKTSLALDSTTSAVRLVALPAGGAILMDEARTKLVWLDDDARSVKAADWPAEGTGDVDCVDGRPAPNVVPTPTPGELVAAPDLAGACVVGDFSWTADGALHWVVSTSAPPDARAELAAIPALWTPKTAASGDPSSFALAPAPRKARCPSDMVLVDLGSGEALCVDRFESTLVTNLGPSGRYLSPDYSPVSSFLSASFSEWSTRRERVGDLFARAMPIPSLPDFEASASMLNDISPIAINRARVRPSGYVTGNAAKASCEAASKRLCKPEEWKTACEGEGKTQFPYGDAFEDGACNVFRDAHPAGMLHGHSSIGHLDPRLNRVASASGPLLRLTGETPRCTSVWGDDAIYDMVGNLDEWVDAKGGAFAGGFYARTTRNGCEAIVDAHPMGYTDYSLGVRCCRDPD